MHIIFGLPYSWIVLLLLIPAAGLKIPRGLRLRGSTFHLKNQVLEENVGSCCDYRDKHEEDISL